MGQPFAPPSAPFDFTAPQIATVTVDGSSDPAGHSCCVIAPPSELEVFLFGGSLVVREPNGANNVPWIDLAAMALNANSEFYGESIGTVAGFSDIKTTVSGTIEQDAIYTTFTIGADGGLPTGQPLTYNLSLFPGLNAEWFQTQYLSFHTQVGISISILSEENLCPVQWPSNDGLEMFVTMEVEDGAEGDADWWLVMLTEDGDFFHFDLETGQFEPGLEATFQGPVMNTPQPISVLPVIYPPTNNTVIVFGVDKNPNGNLDLELLEGTGFTFYF